MPEGLLSATVQHLQGFEKDSTENITGTELSHASSANLEGSSRLLPFEVCFLKPERHGNESFVLPPVVSPFGASADTRACLTTRKQSSRLELKKGCGLFPFSRNRSPFNARFPESVTYCWGLYQFVSLLHAYSFPQTTFSQQEPNIVLEITSVVQIQNP